MTVRALQSFGSSEVMFKAGGPTKRARPSRSRSVRLLGQRRRSYRRIKDRVRVVEGRHNSFYGMREFIFRDLNRFLVTSGQAASSDRCCPTKFEHRELAF